MKKNIVVDNEIIEQRIYIIRGHRVMLDEDLAKLYEVETKALNQATQRNVDRFPSDFAFKLNKEEWNSLKSRFVTSKEGRGGRRKLPVAFTEQGVAMLSSILRSKRAVTVNVEIMRAFVRMRHTLSITTELSLEVKELKAFLLKHSQESSQEFRKIWRTIEKLSTPPEKPGNKIGFKLY